MPKFLTAAVLAGLAALSVVQPASAEQKVFNNPKYKSLALDWCKSWAADCGKPAADAWCVKQGYEDATSFKIYEDIGEPTRIISNNQICDQPECDSFTKITCQKADVYDDGDDAAEIVRINKPMAGARRLDWCLTWASNCGAPAANYYCKKKGYNKAVGFKIAENIFKTRILKTGEKCTQPDCDGFKYIDCQ
jgi:hypothetical protein